MFSAFSFVSEFTRYGRLGIKVTALTTGTLRRHYPSASQSIRGLLSDFLRVGVYPLRGVSAVYGNLTHSHQISRFKHSGQFLDLKENLFINKIDVRGCKAWRKPAGAARC